MRKANRPIQFDLFGNPIEDRPRKADGREIIKLDFEGHPLRMFLKSGDPWWVAADVCKALDIRDAGQAMDRLDDDEKSTFGNVFGAIRDIKGVRYDAHIVNEPGVYRLIFESRTPEAKAFKRWLAHDILPTIRKTGGYSLGRTAKIARRNKCDLDTARVRGDQIDANKRSHGRLYESGASPRDYAAWHNGAYRGQFQRTAAELRGVLDLPSHASPLDRMEQVPLTCNLHAKVIAEKIIEERAKEGRPIPLADQPALVERIAAKMARSDLNRIGADYAYGLVEHDRRGLVIDVVRKQLPAAG